MSFVSALTRQSENTHQKVHVHIEACHVTVELSPNILEISVPSLNHTTPDASKKRPNKAHILKSTVLFYKEFTSPRVPACLRAAKFSLRESDGQELQMKLHIRLPPGPQGDMYTSTLPTPLPNNVTSVSPETDVSSLIDPSPPRAKHPPLIVPQVRKTTAGTQRTRDNKENISHNYKAAFKAETTLLDSYMKKTDGMGEQKVAAQIKEDWRIDISFRTLSRYVNEGNIGVSSLKNDNPEMFYLAYSKPSVPSSRPTLKPIN